MNAFNISLAFFALNQRSLLLKKVKFLFFGETNIKINKVIKTFCHFDYLNLKNTFIRENYYYLTIADLVILRIPIKICNISFNNFKLIQ